MVYQNGKAIAISQASLSSTSSQDIYSTEEQVIGWWIDGRPLYRRVVNATTGNNSSIGEVVAVIPGDPIEAIKLDGIAWFSNGYSMPINCQWIGTDNQISSMMQGNYILCHPASFYVNSPAVFIVDYVKTTDEPMITFNSVQQDSVFHLNLQDTMTPSVMPVTADIYSEAEVIT